MRVDCEGCAGCCVDWRSFVDGVVDQEGVGPAAPLDDVYNLVPLTRDEVRAFVDCGWGDALTPRLWRYVPDGADGDADANDGDTVDASDGDDRDGRSVTVGGIELAAVRGLPAFFVGLRKPPKPVAPVGTDRAEWASSCVFLDPETLQCRIHDDDRYPEECATYPGRNLELGVTSECERVESHTDAPGSRLREDTPPADASPLFGPQALGGKVFVHPEPGELEDVIQRLATGTQASRDRAEFVGTAAAASPGTLDRNEDAYREYRDRVQDTASWISAAVADWRERATTEPADPAVAERVETDRGAPPTPGWD